MGKLKEVSTLLHRDILLGFHAIRLRLLISLFFIIVFIGMSLYQLHNHAIFNGNELSDYTYTDLLYVMFQGTDFQILENPQVGFPFVWLLTQIIIPFIIGGYVREDLFNQATVLMVRAKSKLSLWLSKLLFLFFVVSFVYLFYLIVTFGAAFSFLSFSTEWSDYGSRVSKLLLTADVTQLELALNIFFLLFFSSLLLAVIQGVLSVFVRPIYAIFGILTLLIISVFSQLFLLPGSYSMVLRYELLNLHGFSRIEFIFYFVIVIGLFSAVGYLFFKRSDIIDKED